MGEAKKPVGLRLKEDMQAKVRAHAEARGISQAAAYEELLSAALAGRSVTVALTPSSNPDPLDRAKANMAAALERRAPAIPVTPVQEECCGPGPGIVSQIKGIPVGPIEYAGSFQKGDKHMRRARPES